MDTDPQDGWRDPRLIRPEHVEVLERPGARQSYERRPARLPAAPVTLTIIGLNVLVFLLYNVPNGVPPVQLAFAARGVPELHLPPQYFPQLLTYMFVHANLMHLLGNMLVVFFLGVTVERLYGPWRYAAIYLATGIVSALAQSWIQPEALLLGASGAASAIMVMFVRHFPRAVLYIYGIIPMPAWLFILLWIGFNIFGQQYLPGTQVAYVAHLAGLAAGLVFSLLLLPPGRRR